MKVKLEFWDPNSYSNELCKFYLIKPHSQSTCYGISFYHSFLYLRDFKMSVEYRNSSIYSKFENVLSEIFRREL
jgi:hypothetical protein